MDEQKQQNDAAPTSQKIESIREEYVECLSKTREEELDLEQRLLSQIKKLLEQSYF